MQSRAPIDVSCEAAKDITFSCLRYLAATIIRWVKGVRGRANVLFSPFVRENMLARQARPYLTRWYRFLFNARTVHGAEGCLRVYMRARLREILKPPRFLRATRRLKVAWSLDSWWKGQTRYRYWELWRRYAKESRARFRDFWESLTFVRVGETGPWIIVGRFCKA